VIGLAISLGEVKKKVKVFIQERSKQGSEKVCKLDNNSLIYLILENESQATQFIGEGTEHFGAKI